ncbi:PREDICTED: uncharacterized protein LOC104827500 isoform X1 [Tarenaya hassleriana]|uniref:uncharacterized protein LOC104827500 isoform X1 n=1 Tax=Tarenaya hassleriana TaxID=28532 RepID=UPI00053C52C9|nr:PREDICTED: uncharacterized protein LOC104827500 isoform X1 [Tarenaya hassleriana]
MDEHKEEGGFVGNCQESVKEAGEKLGVSVKTETLGSKVDVHVEDCNWDASMVEGSDHVVKPLNETEGTEPFDDVEICEETVASGEVEITDDTVTPEVERKNGEIESTQTEKTVISVGSDVTDEKAKCDVEAESGGEGEVGETKVVDTEKSSDTAVIKGSEEKKSVKKSEEDDEKMDCDSENMISEVKDEKVGPLRGVQINPETSEPVPALEEPDRVTKGEISEVVDGEELKAEEGNAHDSTKHTSVAETSPEEQITNIDHRKEMGEAMEIDELGGVAGNVDKESSDANTIKTPDVSIGSNVEKKKETRNKYVEEQGDNDGTVEDVTDRIVSKDSTDPDNPIEGASTGEVEQMDHNVLFDPNSDIANYIDFSGVSSWSGNSQEIRTDSGNVSGEDNTDVADTAKGVTTVNGQDGLKPDIEVKGSFGNLQEPVLNGSKGKDTATNLESRDPSTVDGMEFDRGGVDSVNNQAHDRPASASDHPKENSDANLGSSVGEEHREGESTEEQKDMITEQEGDAHKAPNVDPNQMLDTEMAEKPEGSEHDEESSREFRKAISAARVSVSPYHPQTPSFEIGSCIARAASQMAGPASVSKDSTFNDDLSAENFLSQLQSAATDPVKENVVSEIAAGFFLVYRDSMVSQHPPPGKVSGKRVRSSDSNIGGTEAFEFEETDDMSWTDRVIHKRGVEQTPPDEKGDYEIVPVELKPAQIKRSRRPYTKRKHAESTNSNNTNNTSSLLASDKPAGFHENAPAELIMNFSEMDIMPSEISLNKMFRHFGPIREFQTEVDRDTGRARVVFKKCADAEVAYNSVGRFNIFGAKVVNYELSHTIAEPFKIQPYVVTLGQENSSAMIQSSSVNRDRRMLA